MGKIDVKENFIGLVKQYQNLIFSICLKLTGDYFAAEDLTQETFLAAYAHWREFDGRDEKAWLCRIAGNKSIDYRRAAARREVAVESWMLEEGGSAEEPEDSVCTGSSGTGTVYGSPAYGGEPLECYLNRELLEELRTCCDALPPPYRQVARLHFLEGRPAREIAEQSGLGLNTVKTQIRRARELLKKSLGKEVLGR